MIMSLGEKCIFAASKCVRISSPAITKGGGYTPIGKSIEFHVIKAVFSQPLFVRFSEVPVVKLTPDLDLNEVKKEMGDFAKLSVNDDLKIDWDDKQLVVFHFFRSEGESCTIRVWDIEHEPRFVYAVEKGIECITDKVFVHDGHVVIGKSNFLN